MVVLLSTFTSLSLFSAIISHAAAGQAVCRADNCARAVTGTHRGEESSYYARQSCSSFLATTLRGPEPPVTHTYYKTVPNKPTDIPPYASPCKDKAAYSSACSCWGVTATEVTLPPTSTVIVTKPSVCVCGQGLIRCGPAFSNCNCGLTVSGEAFCGVSKACFALSDCKTDADCYQGSACVIDSCCERNVCVQSGICGGYKNMSYRLERASND